MAEERPTVNPTTLPIPLVHPLGGPRAVADLQQLVEKYIEESRRLRNRVYLLEAELMALKGPCSRYAAGCQLWYAHNGPCAIPR